MLLSDFDYKLPKELIAQKPIKPRDYSRLLVLNKKNGEIKHKHFYNLINYLKKGDVLVLNNTRVFPARLIGKKTSGGKIEVFLHKFIKDKKWQCLIGGRGARKNLQITFNKKINCKIIKNNNDGTWDLEFNIPYNEMMEEVEKIGQTPLPPYIKRSKNSEDKEIAKKDKESYQTVYAHQEKKGSVAAPTAGLHFTPELIQKLEEKGIQFEYITLNVGLGTFAPVKTENIKEHKMHAEYLNISGKTIANIYLAKHQKKRIVAVGTTSIRSLETLVSKFPISNFQFPNNFQSKINKQGFSDLKYKKQFKDFKIWTDIFIYPGIKFKITDAIITNFHLPKSTLLMLIQAFAGKKNIDKAYQEAIQKHYRFFSYGDAMLIS